MQTSDQLKSPECHQYTRLPPISAPAAKCSQNAEGLSLTLPAAKYASPTNSVTTADQLPPPEMRSVTKIQPTNAEMDAMNGKRKRRRSASAPPSTSARTRAHATRQ